MKKGTFFFALLVAMSFSFAPPPHLEIGALMPKTDVKMIDVVSGGEVSLKDIKRKNGLLVMFSCNTCPYVRKNQQRKKDIANYALEKEIGVILLNANAAQRNGNDSHEAMKRYAAAQDYQWPYAADEKNELADAFGATRTPENFLFDKEGRLVYNGAIDDNPDASSVKSPYLKTAIDEMLKGAPVSLSHTVSVRCGIKRLK